MKEWKGHSANGGVLGNGIETLYDKPSSPSIVYTVHFTYYLIVIQGRIHIFMWNRPYSSFIKNVSFFTSYNKKLRYYGTL